MTVFSNWSESAAIDLITRTYQEPGSSADLSRPVPEANSQLEPDSEPDEHYPYGTESASEDISEPEEIVAAVMHPRTLYWSHSSFTSFISYHHGASFFFSPRRRDWLACIRSRWRTL
jgi:hypothetical protein